MAMHFLVGAACSVLGGYVAARIAKRDEILNTAVSSFLCVGMELYAMLPPKRQWFNRLAG